MIAESQKNSVLVGDFNLPITNWGGGAASGGNEGFVQALQDHYFEQLMDFPTHTKGNCLDLIVTNVPGTGRISNISEEGRLGKSDHGIICFDLLVDKKDFKESRNWRRADWAGLKRSLEEADWPEVNDDITAEEAWKQLRPSSGATDDEYVPKCTFRPRKSDWMNGNLLREIRRKRRLWNKFKIGGSKDEYLDAERSVKKAIRSAKRSMEKKLAREKVGNSRQFFSYVKKKTKTRVAGAHQEGEWRAD